MNYLTLVNRILNETDEGEIAQGSFSSATGLAKRVKNYVNDICNDIFSRSNDWSWREALGTITTVASTDTYSLAADCDPDEVKIFYHNDTKYPLEYMDYEQFQRNYASMSLVGTQLPNSRPTTYTVFKQQVQVWPVPDAVYTIKYSYLTMHTDLSTYSDSPTIPTRYHHVIVKGGAWMAKKYLGDPDWQADKQIYEQAIDVMIKQNRRFVDRQPAQQGELDYFDEQDLY